MGNHNYAYSTDGGEIVMVDEGSSFLDTQVAYLGWCDLFCSRGPDQGAQIWGTLCILLAQVD